MFKKNFSPFLILSLLTFIGVSGFSQVPDNIMTESGTILREAPLDDITGSSIKQTKNKNPNMPCAQHAAFCSFLACVRALPPMP